MMNNTIIATEEELKIIKDLDILLSLGMTDRDCRVIQLRFGFVDGKKHTYKSIGELSINTHRYRDKQIKKISSERVRQILYKSLRKVRKYLREF